MSSIAPRKFRLASALVFASIVWACSTLRVGSDYDHDATFSGYHNFGWLERQHRGTRNPLVAQRARDAIQAQLTHKGFTYVSDNSAADFVVDFSIGARDRLDVETYPAPYAGPWDLGVANWWGSPYWGSATDVRQYREGSLTIDIFDARSHRPVWHGWAKKELTESDIDRSEAPIREAVAAVLAEFPRK